MSNDELVAEVTRELYWDPSLDSGAIAVSAEGGCVTLRGTVGGLREKRTARKVAERVFGVTGVDNQLQVRILTGSGRDDADLRAEVLQALMLNSVVPSTVDAFVSNHGFVTLTGTVAWQYQRDEAERVTASVFGVRDLLDEIVLDNPVPTPDDVQDSIKQALRRNARIEDDDLTVATSNGIVTVSGVVRSWAAHDEAIAAAWASPGVIDVEDGIRVEYQRGP